MGRTIKRYIYWAVAGLAVGSAVAAADGLRLERGYVDARGWVQEWEFSNGVYCIYVSGGVGKGPALGPALSCDFSRRTDVNLPDMHSFTNPRQDGVLI